MLPTKIVWGEKLKRKFGRSLHNWTGVYISPPLTPGTCGPLWLPSAGNADRLIYPIKSCGAGSAKRYRLLDSRFVSDKFDTKFACHFAGEKPRGDRLWRDPACKKSGKAERSHIRGPHSAIVEIRSINPANFTKWIFLFIFLTRKKIKSLGQCILLRKKVMRLITDKLFFLSQRQILTILSISLNGGSIVV